MYDLILKALKAKLNPLNYPVKIYNQPAANTKDEPQYDPISLFIEFGTWETKSLQPPKILYQGDLPFMVHIMAEYTYDVDDITTSSSVITEVTQALIGKGATLSSIQSGVDPKDDLQLLNAIKLTTIQPDYSDPSVSHHILQFNTIASFILTPSTKTPIPANTPIRTNP